MKKQKTQNKGITLIALVITIIVMLILVAVTISMAVNGGLFEYAQRAGTKTNEATEAEQLLASGRVEIDGTVYNSVTEYVNSGVVTTPNSDPEPEIQMTYTDKNGNAKALTDPVATGDIVLCGDYKYIYNLSLSYEYYMYGAISYYEGNNSWGVIAIYNSTGIYGDMESSLLGHPVVSIDYAFALTGGNVVRVGTLPSGVKDMTYTFYGCNNLESVTLPASLETIGAGTFYGCSSLTNVTIPSSVTSIASDAFKNVPHITHSGTVTGSPWGAKSEN